MEGKSEHHTVLEINMFGEESLFLYASEGNMKAVQALIGLESPYLYKRDAEGATLLHCAAKNNQILVMQHLIESKINVNVADQAGNTALHVAVLHGHIGAMNMLLTFGASDKILNHQFEAPIHIITKADNEALLCAFLSHHHVDLLIPGKKSQTVLHLIAENNLLGLTLSITNSQQFKRAITQSDTTTGFILTRTDENGLTPLHLAARRGSPEVLDLLIKTCLKYGHTHDQVLSILDEDSSTPLHLAVDSGHPQIVDVLLKHGASPLTVVLEEAPVPLHLACTKGRLEMIRIMVKHCGKEILTHKNPGGMTSLHYSASASNADVIPYLLGQEVLTIDEADALGHTPLHRAIIAGNLANTKELINSKANPLLKNTQLMNVLHFTVTKNRNSILEYLLSIPGVPELLKETNKAGDTPIHMAIKKNVAQLCNTMLRESPPENVKDASGNYYLHLLSTTGNFELLKEVLRMSPCYLNVLNEANACGETPLHLAAEGGYSECVEILLDHGAFVHKCHTGMTAFLHASANGHTDSAKILLYRFPYLKDFVDSRGSNALHFAALSGNPATITCLLDEGLKPILNNASQGFLDLAIDGRHCELIKAVLNHDRWEECLGSTSPNRVHPMLQFVRDMPGVAKTVLDRCHRKAAIDPSHPDYWEEFNFKYMLLRQSNSDVAADQTSIVGKQEIHPLQELQTHKDETSRRVIRDLANYETMTIASKMMESDSSELIHHPVVSMYIKSKWNSYGIWVYSSVFVFRFLLAVLISIYVLLVIDARPAKTLQSNTTNTSNSSSMVPPQQGTNPAAESIRVIALLINLFLFLHLLFPIISIGVQIFNFLLHISLWMYIIAMIMNFIFLLTPNPLNALPSGALACFFSWFMVLIGLGFFDILGIYVQMFLRITRTVFQVLVLSMSLVLAFSFAFYILVSYGVPEFSGIDYSLVHTFFYMLGDFQVDVFFVNDFEGTLPNGRLTFLFLILIAILLSIVMSNLLIGLAVGDIEKIKKNASTGKKKMLISYFRQIDKVKLFKRFNHLSLVKYPNANVSKARQIWRHVWRAAKEDAAIEEESESGTTTRSTEEKLDYIIDNIDKLTLLVKELQKKHSDNN